MSAFSRSLCLRSLYKEAFFPHFDIYNLSTIRDLSHTNNYLLTMSNYLYYQEFYHSSIQFFHWRSRIEAFNPLKGFGSSIQDSSFKTLDQSIMVVWSSFKILCSSSRFIHSSIKVDSKHTIMEALIYIIESKLSYQYTCLHFKYNCISIEYHRFVVRSTSTTF